MRYLLLAFAALLPAVASAAQPIPAGSVRIHYHRADNTYTGWGLYTWNASTENNVWCSSESPVSGNDSFGIYFDVPVSAAQGNPAGDLGFIINNCANGGTKDPGPDQHLNTLQSREVWILSGNATVYTTEPTISGQPVPPGDVRIHYHRTDGNYGGWTIFGWNATATNYSWCSVEAQPSGADGFGAYFDIPVDRTAGNPAGQLGFIIHNCSTNTKDPGPDQFLQTTESDQAWVVSGMPTVFTALPALGNNPIPPGDVRIHYQRPDNNYSGWALFSWNASTQGGSWCFGEAAITGIDGFGVYFDIPVNGPNGNPKGDLGFIINNCDAGQIKDPGPDQHLDTGRYQQGWVVSGNATVYTSAPLPAGDVRIHYYRPDGNYTGWAVYTWNATNENASWCQSEVQPTGMDDFGAYFDVSVSPSKGTPAGDLGFIINNCGQGQIKDPGPDQHLDTTRYRAAWVISGEANVFTTQPTPGQIAGVGLFERKAFWINRNTIAIPAAGLHTGSHYVMSYCTNASITVDNNGHLTGGLQVPLTYFAGGLTDGQKRTYPELIGYAVFHLPGTFSLSNLKVALTAQIEIAGLDATGKVTYVNAVQTAGVLDDLFAYSGKLGPTFDDHGVSVKLWAPTAQFVKLFLFDHASDTTPIKVIDMSEKGGVWTATGDESWKGKYYLYDVHVYVPQEQKIVDNFVVDPYSADVALNGVKTRLTDLNEWATKPLGWDETGSPKLASVDDLSLYELHVREFSVRDNTVPEKYRGTYLAFTDFDSDGMKHLRRLAREGLRAIHIMPSMFIASVNEDKSKWKSPGNLAAFAPDSEQQQAAIAAVKDQDGYNFGYDPVLYLTPNGAYAYNPNHRVKEYREMVMGLHQAGLRVVQDVVFNHTSRYGQTEYSVLDKIVPDYYYRLDVNGNVGTASCCFDTASEHRMFEKLMIDTVVQNAKQYKIDGFRFDDMSLHFVSNMQHIKSALAALTPEKDGVDGSKIYIYGEGWLNPESAAIGKNATQANLYRTGVGTFNDRMRDSVRGGSAADSSTERVQGFATGLFTDPSSYTEDTLGQSADDQKAALLAEADLIKISLAGNLRDFSFVDRNGDTVKAGQVIYGGQPAGYAASPLETVNYCSVHDNQPLFDAIQIKSSEGDASAARERRQVLAMSLVALGQGVPFFLAGDDLLRSKDMDNNSYNSGDWFNSNDWSGESNNWGIGLPAASENQNQWPFMKPLLANPLLKPTPQEIQQSGSSFGAFMRIRNTSRLFRMGSLAEIQNNLHFLNSGPNQVPGLIVMKLDANVAEAGAYRHIVVVFNAQLGEVDYQDAALKGEMWHLHPLQRNGVDPVVKTATLDGASGSAKVPGLTTAVFVAQ